MFQIALELRRNYSIVEIILIQFKKVLYKCSFMANFSKRTNLMCFKNALWYLKFPCEILM